MKSLLPALICVASLPLLSSAAHAAVLYTTTFTGTANTLPSGWNSLAGGTGSPTTNGWFIDGLDGNYRFRTTSTGTSGLTSYTGPLSDSSSSSSMTNFIATTSFIRTTGNGVSGIAGRIVNDTTYYHLRLSDNNVFNLYRFAGGGNALLSTVTIVAGDVYETGQTWSMSLTFVGNRILGTLTDNDNKVVATIDYTDTAANAISAGAAGLRSQNGFEYTNFTIEQIPEPSAAALGALGALALISRRRRG